MMALVQGWWRKVGLARQLWLLLVIPTALALGLYGTYSHSSRQRVIMAEASAELRNYATLVEAALVKSGNQVQPGTLQQRLEAMAQAERIAGVAAFEEGGNLVLVTAAIQESRGELAEIAQRALANKHDVEEQRDLPFGPTLIRTVTLQSPTSGSKLVVVIARDMQYITALAHVLDRGLAITGAIVIALIALVVGFVSRRTVGLPVLGIVRGAERVAAGDLSTKVEELGALELRRLARSFNEMTAALAETRAELDRESENRAAIERRLTHFQALAAAGQVAASVGHEIGSPLNVILGRARRAAGLASCSDVFKKEFEIIAHQSERISRVVSGLLAVARPRSRGKAGGEVAKVVDDVLAFLAPECRRRGIRWITVLADGGARVVLDSDSVFQIVFNLCMNAMQAQPNGGEITVTVGRASASANGEDRVYLEVADSGPGIPDSARERVFDPFYTTKSDAGGSGLGLAIVSGIVRDAGGKVELTSDRRTGACFRVVLPEQPNDEVMDKSA